MNPITQRLMGLGGLIGFIATFVAGQPMVGAGLALLQRSILGGIIFGALGYAIGTLMHRAVEEQLEREIEALILQKELKRQEERRRAEEAQHLLEGITTSDASTQAVETEAAVASEESPAPGTT